MAQHADRKVADVPRERGGNASNLNKLETGSGERTLGEVAEKAAKGDRVSKDIIKIVKQAKQKGQRRY